MSTSAKIRAGVASAAHPPGEDVTGGASGEAKPRRSRSQIAKANNSKGKERERRVVNYLRESGFPGAERTIRTGYRNSGREFCDRGDIDGTPGIGWQIKAVAEREWYRVPQFMADAEKQADAAGADLGILVIVRTGHASPGEWWAHVWFDDLVTLVSAGASGRHLHVPVRLELRHLVPLLRVAGYGTPLDPAELAAATTAASAAVSTVEAGA